MVRASTLLTFIAMIVLAGSFGGGVSGQATPTVPADVPVNLAPPEDSVLLFSLGARGVQIYTCEADPDDATSFVWTFTAAEAEVLNARDEVVGTHFAGPSWQGHDGSIVVGAVLERADAPDAGAIPWLLLEATSHEGTGVFTSITHIQRLDTVGGVAPAEGCDEAHAGEETRVAYTATYAFYYPAAPMIGDAASPTVETGTLTVRVLICPGELSLPAGEGQVDQTTLLAACLPLPAEEAAPTLRSLPDGEPLAGTVTEPGIYRWEGLSSGDYAFGGSDEPSPDLGSLLVTDASGAILQNPVVRLDEATPDAEYRYFYFPADAPPAATPAS